MIHFFNPGHETAVQNASPYYMAPTNVATLQHELAFLPAWYANKNDAVLIYSRYDKDFFYYLSDFFPSLPNAIMEDELPDFDLSDVCLWGISPQAIHFFGTLNKKYGLNLRLPEWQDDYTYLNSRQAAKDCLAELQRLLPEIDDTIIPRFCNDLDEIENLLAVSPYRLLAKAPYSSSGRGLLWLPADILPRSERQILHGILKRQGAVSIERVLNKQLDFAMEFMCDGKGGIAFEGYSLFSTNEKGAYKGNFLSSQQTIEGILTSKIDLSVLESVKDCLLKILSTRYACNYKGCIGVDMMIYEDNDKYCIHPCLEINMRYNMGYLSLCFAKRFMNEGSSGYYQTDFSPTDGMAYSIHRQMLEKHPARFRDGKIVSGYLPLCPVTENSHYRAYVLIDEGSE